MLINLRSFLSIFDNIHNTIIFLINLSMRVFENNHLTIDYFSEKLYVKVVRLSSGELAEEAYKNLMLEWKEQIVYYKPLFQLVNYLNYYRPIPSHMQAWLNDNLIRPAFEAGLKKVAFIISRDLYVQVSLEQTMQEEAGKNLTVKYFDNELDAEKWLFDNNKD